MSRRRRGLVCLRDGTRPQSPRRQTAGAAAEETDEISAIGAADWNARPKRIG
jgi:hypothetical protein